MEEPVKWKFRPPPRGVPKENLKLCETHENGSTCRMAEHCVEAHGNEELEEWRERWEERLKSEDGADQSYSEKILDEVLNAERSTPMSETVAGVKVTCDQDTTIKFSCRNSSTVWNFNIKSEKLLKGVTLLGVEHLQHFSICDVALVSLKGKVSFETKPQECVIEEDETEDEKEEEEGEEKVEEEKTPDEEKESKTYYYTLKLKFHSKIFGTFKQTVVFDFGERPLLSKTVIADVVPFSHDSDVQSVKESILFISDLWDSTNSDLVHFEPTPPKVHQDEKELLSAYPAPQPSKFEMSDAVTGLQLTRDNYKERMHQLLYIEEMSQFQALDGFNALIKVQLASRYLMSASPSNSSTAKYARPGELFGRIELNSELSEDSQAGRLILTKCSSILLKFDTGISESKKKKKEKKVKLNRKKIWECLIEDTAKAVIYVRLSTAMVKENKLTPDMKIKAEVQFKLSRISLVEMHYAIEKISDMSVVHPDISAAPTIPWSPASQWAQNLDSRLNPKQKEAIIAVTAPMTLSLPPILIIGPYGTGKTFALGKAIEHLLTQEGCKILVCTHSNSAADLYIKEYLDPAFTEGKIDKKLLRVYYHNRWVQTVHPTIQKYCLIESDPVTSTRKFKTPTLEDLKDKDIIVATLSTSRCIAELLPVGHFTHIILDEAAQAMETEAIMPLVLADKETRVVLAGDHMQLEPNVTSDFAKEKHLNVSLLERLYDLYPSDFPCKILLCENYRSHEAIVSYTSELFYEQKLVASGKPPSHPSWYPLTFFTARGEDIQDPNSTSFYNNSEVYEIVDRLAELKRNWPKAWGRKEETEIGVVTPYHDQVMRIRSELRKKKLYNISVERVLNVQGKQYRAIFISTVRTRGTCFKTDNNDMKTLDYGFLSSAKLLNTAITRAQSLVAVVGDPVALSSVGKCRKLWERFIEICHVRKSIHGFTWDDLKSHLEAIELKKIYGLNPLAPEFVPRAVGSGKTADAERVNTSFPSIPTMLPPLLPYLGMIPPRFLNPPPLPYLTPPSVPMINPRGMPYMHNFPPLPPPWSRPPFPPMGSPPYPPTSFMRPPIRPLTPRQAYPIISRPNLEMFPFFPPFPPQISSGGPFFDAPPITFGSQGMLSSTLTVNSSEPLYQNNISSSLSVPNLTMESTQSKDLEKILPRGVDLTTMLSSPDLQQAWHSHLVANGQLKEAEAFQMLVSNANTAQKPQVAVDTQECDTNSSSSELPDNPQLRQPIHSPDSGCFSSPPDTNRPHPPKDSLADVFESLLADFESMSAWPSSPNSSENVPLYMRRAHTTEQEEDKQVHGLLLDTVSSKYDGETLLAIHHHQQSQVDRDAPIFRENKLPQQLFQRADNVASLNTDVVKSEPMVQTYAGVLRTPPKKLETDPLIKIRNLGTMGSQV
eukprot:TRINITY_DN7638_c0_g1_i1.p1 TRINITY_DN7638_c0_g1~~TRINITY_DN7638_c0_g1_i1.p1  ORF type:complete len:1395 (-),score=231.54 TRINITY_DN7638_c0_g1_i1:680-4864(-)